MKTIGCLRRLESSSKEPAHSQVAESGERRANLRRNANVLTGTQIEIREVSQSEMASVVEVIARGMRDNPLHIKGVRGGSGAARSASATFL